MKREIILIVAGVGLLLIVAGCTGSKPHPVKVETIPPPILTQSNPPPAIETVPAISRPRPPADASDNMAANILAWDAVTKEYRARPGETNAPFTFNVTNVSPERVLIYDLSTTCECTLAQLPSKPWPLAPGAGGEIHATLDLHGRTSAVTNYVIVFTSKGNRLLTVKGVPATP